jgi:hypothetical protein
VRAWPLLRVGHGRSPYRELHVHRETTWGVVCMVQRPLSVARVAPPLRAQVSRRAGRNGSFEGLRGRVI